MVPTHSTPLVLPPPFRAIPVPGEVWPAALDAAPTADPGTVLWSERGGRAQAAVVLAPEVPLVRGAELVLKLAGLAAAEAIAALGPPKLPVAIAPPDRIEVDEAVVGGVRIAAPVGSNAADEPEWMLAGIDIAIDHADPQAPGRDPWRTALAEEGMRHVAASEITEQFCRCLLVWIARWQEEGDRVVHAAWQEFSTDGPAMSQRLSRERLTRDAGPARDALSCLAGPSWIEVPARARPRLQGGGEPKDFWLQSGFHLTEPAQGKAGRVITDRFLRAYLARPEIRLTEGAGTAERDLHRALMDDPRRPVGASMLAQIGDAAVRENYEVWLRFRERLLVHQTIEGTYLSLIEQPDARTPTLFLDHLVQIILRDILDGTEDPLLPRAGELLFRPQQVAIVDGAVVVADAETVARRAAPAAEGGVPSIDLDILTPETAPDRYWSSSDRFELGLDLSLGQPGLAALCRVLEAWISRFRGVSVSIVPIRAIEEERWAWHIGLDAVASNMMNRLYRGDPVQDGELARVLALFRLEFASAEDMLPRIAGRAVYLALAMTETGQFRLKPQNLLVNLPMREVAG